MHFQSWDMCWNNFAIAICFNYFYLCIFFFFFLDTRFLNVNLVCLSLSYQMFLGTHLLCYAFLRLNNTGIFSHAVNLCAFFVSHFYRKTNWQNVWGYYILQEYLSYFSPFLILGLYCLTCCLSTTFLRGVGFE